MYFQIFWQIFFQKTKQIFKKEEFFGLKKEWKEKEEICESQEEWKEEEISKYCKVIIQQNQAKAQHNPQKTQTKTHPFQQQPRKSPQKTLKKTIFQPQKNPNPQTSTKTIQKKN